jgi:hypothetical protein
VCALIAINISLRWSESESGACTCKLNDLRGANSSWRCNSLSANGANCNSQGQVLSKAKHVAPGPAQQKERALKVPHWIYRCDFMPLFQSLEPIRFTFQGRRALLRSALCPWLLHSRAFGAQSAQFFFRRFGPTICRIHYLEFDKFFGII